MESRIVSRYFPNLGLALLVFFVLTTLFSWFNIIVHLWICKFILLEYWYQKTKSKKLVGPLSDVKYCGHRNLWILYEGATVSLKFQYKNEFLVFLNYKQYIFFMHEDPDMWTYDALADFQIEDFGYRVDVVVVGVLCVYLHYSQMVLCTWLSLPWWIWQIFLCL